MSIPKMYFCKDCKNNVTILKWKEISNCCNNGDKYKCLDCWNKFDENLDTMCKLKLESRY